MSPSSATRVSKRMRRGRGARGGRVLTREREAATAVVTKTIRKRRQRRAASNGMRMENDLSQKRLTMEVEQWLRRGHEPGFQTERLFPVYRSQKEIEEEGIQCLREEMKAEEAKKKKKEKNQGRNAEVKKPNGKLTGNKRVNENGKVEYLVEYDDGKEYNTDDLCFNEPAGAYFKKFKFNEHTGKLEEKLKEEDESDDEESSSDESEPEIKVKVENGHKVKSEASSSKSDQSKSEKVAIEGNEGKCKIKIELVSSSDEEEKEAIPEMVQRRLSECKIEKEIPVVTID